MKMKNITKPKILLSKIRCINKSTNDYVEIECPFRALPDVRLALFRHAKYWVDGYECTMPDEQPVFDYYVYVFVGVNTGGGCVQYNGRGIMFDISLDTHELKDYSLMKIKENGLTEEQFYDLLTPDNLL